DVLRFLRRRARRPLPRREPRARPRAARGTGPARLPRLPRWARRDGLERARDGVAPVSAGTPRARALTEEIPRAKGQDALDVHVVVRRGGSRAESGEVLRTCALTGRGEPARERNSQLGIAELARAERSVGGVENRREIDLDAGVPQRGARRPPGLEGLLPRDGLCGGARRRQVG